MPLPQTVVDLAVGNALPESWVDAVRLNLLDLDERTNDLDYAQVTTNGGYSAATYNSEANSALIISGNSIVYTNTRKRLEFYCPLFQGGASNLERIAFYRGASIVGQHSIHNDGAPYCTQFDPTPGAGTYFYSVRAWGSNAQTFTFNAGPGGSGQLGPMYLRVTRADI